MNPILFDVAVAAVILLSLLRGYRRGFVLTLCGFLAIFVAFLGARYLSDMLAEPIAQTLQPIIERNILHHLNSIPAASPANPQDAGGWFLEDLPLDSLLRFLESSELYRIFSQGFREFLAQQGPMVGSAVSALSRHIAVEVARTVLFLISFLLILILWHLASHALDLAFHLPVLSALNRWSGALVGLLRGVLLVYLLCWLLKDKLITAEVLEHTYLLPYFCTVPKLPLLP